MPRGLRLCSLHLALILALGCIPALIPPPELLFAEPEIPVPPSAVSGMDDVSPFDWFYTYVRIGYRHGFLHGRDGNFEPDRALTRAEFIITLGRFHRALGGYVDYNETTIGTDTGAYMPYLLWASGLHILVGDDPGRFRPNDPILRAEMAAMLMNYLNVYSLYDHFLPQYEDYEEDFADFSDIPSWARSAAQSLRNFGVIQGIRRSADPPDVYRFEPFAQTRRSEAAAIFGRMFLTIFDGMVAV